ncbi:MAG TPA: uroporphyrinogen-III synthase, partial [Edaphobacter sp.]|nr:uroporphyrinogen-III synthase [Edaphobacter sp.]
MAPASFDGLRILSLESRRAVEMTKLIRTFGGEPFVVPAMREISLESNRLALDFIDKLIAGEFDLVIFLTGVGVRTLMKIVDEAGKRDAFLEALKANRIAARGPKPVAALRELAVPVAVVAPEPNTWREMVGAIEKEYGEGLSGFRVAVQEYGTSNPDLLEALNDKAVSVTKVPVYQWALPEELQPLREAVLGLSSGGIDVVLFTTGVQVVHLFEVAGQMGAEEDLRAGLRSVVVASIGPTTTEVL